MVATLLRVAICCQEITYFVPLVRGYICYNLGQYVGFVLQNSGKNIVLWLITIK